MLSITGALTACNGIGDNGRDPSEDNPSADGSATPTVTLTNTSFFEEVFFGIDPEKEVYVNDVYRTFPRGQNMTALLSRNTVVYNDINGSRVLADAYYGGEDEALNDPDAGVGMLLYSAITYKIANPDENVSISLVCGDMSLSTAVCVIPQSRYFGYMRALEGKDYDGNGFIRIAFLLVEAAKMGIDVTVVGQTSGEESSEKPEDSFESYFGNALKQDCYGKYAKGAKVADYMSFSTVDWKSEENGDKPMVGLTALTVSSYLDRYGESHENAVFFSQTALSAVDGKGLNGPARSGVAITGHGEIYNATVNFIDLVAANSGAEGFDTFKKTLEERSSAQRSMIESGFEYLIAENEQIVWLGGWNDSVFKLCFAQGGAVDGENIVRDSFCEKLESLGEAATLYPNDHRILSLSGINSSLLSFADGIVNTAFVENSHAENRLEIRADGYKNEALSELLVGESIGYLDLDGSFVAGSAEALLSYIENDERKFVSLILSGDVEKTSCINSMLSITESEKMGDAFYASMGVASTDGCIKEEGIRFSTDSIIYQSQSMGTLPQTFSATFEIDEIAVGKNNYYGMLFSNYDNWNSQFSYEIMKNGVPRVTVWITEFVPDATRENGDHYKMTKLYFKFDKVDVRDYSTVNLTIVHDRIKQEMRCYVNGECKQTIKQSKASTNLPKGETAPPLYDFETVPHFVVGGNWVGSNGQHFRGLLKSLALWSDVRSDSEIAEGVSGAVNTDDLYLLAAYDFRNGDKESLKDLSAKGNDLIEDVLWLDVDEVEPVEDFAYSFALIGDIQVLTERYFNDHFKSDKNKKHDPYDDEYVDEDTDPRDNEIEYIESMINWIIGNREEQKINYVITLGDLTQQSYTAEWDYVRDQFYRLYGVVPFMLTPGNHDRRDPEVKQMTEHGYDIWPEELRKNAYFHEIFGDEIYRSQIDGNMYDWDMANTYKAFTVGDVKYLLLSLDYGASDEMLEWASGIVEQYKDHRVIVVTHAYLYRDGTTVDAYDTYAATRVDGGVNDADEIWEKFASKHENISLVISGHDPWDHIVRTESVGDNGNVVNQLLVDPQGMDAYMPHCAGMIAMLYFSEDGNRITVRYYSPVNNRYGSEKSQFTFTLNE